MSVAALPHVFDHAQGKVYMLIDYSWPLVAAPKVMGNAGATTTTSAVFKGNLPALFTPIFYLCFKMQTLLNKLSAR